jgi:hypothetical protein
MSIAQLISGTDPVAELGLSLYEIQPIPGKGKGLVARFNIAKGTKMLVEEPLFKCLVRSSFERKQHCNKSEVTFERPATPIPFSPQELPRQEHIWRHLQNQCATLRGWFDNRWCVFNYLPH